MYCLLPIISTPPFILSIQILLQSDESSSGSRGSLWRLVKLGPIVSDGQGRSRVGNPTLQDLIIDSPASMTAETIIDAEGSRLGGNGELVITTTTTTVVRRVAV